MDVESTGCQIPSSTMQPEQNRRMGLAVVLIGVPFRRIFFSKAVSVPPTIAVTETTLS
jgi:hypothetical protein